MSKVIRTYKRKLKLNKGQEARISSWIGACRTIYNLGLEIRIAAWKTGRSVHKYELMKQITAIRDIDWIEDAPIMSLQDSVERLDRSYKSFFKRGGFPKFAKKSNYRSVTFKKVKVENNFVVIPKIGKLKTFKDRKIKGIPKRAIITKEITGYYISIQCETLEAQVYNADKSQICGIDMGISHFCIDSDGGFVTNEKHFSKYERQIRIENRSLSRKKLFGKNWKKQVIRIGKLNNKIANVRKDFIHKQTTDYARRYNTIIMEDLKIANMVKNHNLSKHILDCGWGMFRTILEYKASVIRINPKHTSQKCNLCNHIDSNSRTSQSTFICKKCGHSDNADLNAAKNIRGEGIAIIRKRETLVCA